MFLSVIVLLSIAIAVVAIVYVRHRRALIRKLHDNEARLQDFLGLSSDWIWEQDAQFRFRLISGNIVGDQQRIIGKTRWELPILGVSEEQWRAHRETLARHEPFRGLIYQWISESGESHWYVTNGKPLFDRNGVFCGYRGTGSDITERLKAEQLARRHSDEIRLIYDTANVSIFNVDEKGVITHANQCMSEMFGYPMEALIGREYVALIHPLERETGRHAMFALMRSEIAAIGNERYYQRSDGSEFWGHISGRRIFDEDKRIIGLVGVISDKTEQKMAQDTLQKINEILEQEVIERTRELEAFSYSVSHDLRAPLRAINGFSQLLEQEHAQNLNEEARGYLARIRAGSIRMGELIDDLYELSKITRQTLNHQPVDLSALAGEIVRELAETDPARSVSWQIVENVTARCDSGLMRLVLTNLLGNAWKYSSKNPAARIEFGIDEGPDGVVYFVRDNGVGFDMRFADKLFGAFQRLHDAADFQGSGIGLAIVERIIKRHGGQIWGESRPNEGAIFRFTLKAAQKD